MREKRNHNPAGQIALGIFVILMGIGFMLDNLGWLSFNPSVHLLPLMMIVFGIVKVVQTRTTQGVFIGAALILFGVVASLKAMGLLYVSWRDMWPVFMIALGLMVVFRSVMRQRRGDQPTDPFIIKTPLMFSRQQDMPSDDSTINVAAVMGGFVRRITSPDFRGGEVTVIMAGCELDLRQSSINGEAVLNVFALFGGIQIKVPPDWSVVLQGTPVMGGFDERTVWPPDTSKRLIIRGVAIMGGVEVRN
jgi:predicted membrane protein